MCPKWRTAQRSCPVRAMHARDRETIMVRTTTALHTTAHRKSKLPMALDNQFDQNLGLRGWSNQAHRELQQQKKNCSMGLVDVPLVVGALMMQTASFRNCGGRGHRPRAARPDSEARTATCQSIV